jgi:hypothetical protein
LRNDTHLRKNSCLAARSCWMLCSSPKQLMRIRTLGSRCGAENKCSLKVFRSKCQRKHAGCRIKHIKIAKDRLGVVMRSSENDEFGCPFTQRNESARRPLLLAPAHRYCGGPLRCQKSSFSLMTVAADGWTARAGACNLTPRHKKQRRPESKFSSFPLRDCHEMRWPVAGKSIFDTPYLIYDGLVIPFTKKC